MQADIFGQNIYTINAEQGPAFGVGLLAAVGAGAYKNIEEACQATIRTVSETETDRAAKKTYNKAFPVFQQLYHSLKDDFAAIAKL